METMTKRNPRGFDPFWGRNAEAEAIIAKDRESHQRDLYDAIERGDYSLPGAQLPSRRHDECRGLRAFEIFWLYKGCAEYWGNH